MSTLQQWLSAQASPETVVNENFDTVEYTAVYGKNPQTTTGLTWGYYGGRWSGFAVTTGTLTLTDASTNYVVTAKADGAISTATSSTNWNDTGNYARIYKLTTSGGLVTATEDHRAGQYGIFGDGAANAITAAIPVAVSDETTDLMTGTAKVTFRMPYAMTLTEVRASVTTAPTGSALTVDINQSGTSILSTKLTIDATEKTSTTAATPAVISTASLTDDAEITIDIDTVGSTVAGAGLKVYLIGVQA